VWHGRARVAAVLSACSFPAIHFQAQLSAKQRHYLHFGSAHFSGKCKRLTFENTGKPVPPRRHALPCQVSLETPMACGLGICFSCVAKIGQQDDWDYKRTCIEGPIFDAQSIVWD